MKRLSFVLNEWTRSIWIAKADAREIWEPRFRKISIMWSDLEKLTVLDGLRDAAMLFVDPNNIPALTKWSVDNDLLLLPMEQGGVSTSYHAGTVAYKEGNPFKYRVVLIRKENVDLAYECAYPQQVNDDLIGKILGFPTCCREFFLKYWAKQEYRDTSWPMAVRTIGTASDDVYEIDIKNTHLNCNILWHWLGIRLTMHLPCSFTCEPTIKLVNDIIQCGNDNGFVEQLDWVQEILSWPVEWSALHGIAEIKTPILKVSTRTDATSDKYVIRYHGDNYPVEGATGVVFPYKKSGINLVTEGKAFKRAFDVPLPPRIAPVSDVLSNNSIPEINPPSKIINSKENEWVHNGFISKEAMDNAHAVLLQMLKNHFKWGDCCGSVLDLGCGNGVLLGKICSEYNGLTPHGVEILKDRFFSAYAALSDTGEIAIGSISNLALWPKDKYDLVVLMPRRIKELGSDGKAVRERLLQVTNTFLLYGYGDDIDIEEGGLDSLNKYLDLPVDRWTFSKAIETEAASALLAVRKE